jgi:hypothetical protein
MHSIVVMTIIIVVVRGSETKLGALLCCRNGPCYSDVLTGMNLFSKVYDDGFMTITINFRIP